MIVEWTRDEEAKYQANLIASEVDKFRTESPDKLNGRNNSASSGSTKKGGKSPSGKNSPRKGSPGNKSPGDKKKKKDDKGKTSLSLSHDSRYECI